MCLVEKLLPPFLFGSSRLKDIEQQPSPDNYIGLPSCYVGRRRYPKSLLAAEDGLLLSATNACVDYGAA
jgi:hypothetical protein